MYIYVCQECNLSSFSFFKFCVNKIFFFLELSWRLRLFLAHSMFYVAIAIIQNTQLCLKQLAHS